MFCGRCGAENPEVNRFCFECGSRLFAVGTRPGPPLVDEVAARLHGLGSLPAPELVWPDDLPKEVTGRDGMTQRLVPPGFFWMGARKQKKDERPYRLVWLDAYYIDETPVTNGMYEAFVARTGRRTPPGFRAQGDDWGSHPVVGVTWEDALAYARWVTRRLPTEAEWEKAARGVDGRSWPWGDEPPEGQDPPVANLGDEDGAPSPVGSFPEGRSPIGALDMAGNVWEWCQDQYDQYYYPRSAPRNPRCDDGDERYRVLRGGAYSYSSFAARASFRGFNLPHLSSPTYGFRCAVDAERFRRKA